MKACLVFLLFSAAGAVHTFDEFVQHHNRSYQRNTAEYDMRRLRYEEHVTTMHAQNSNPNRMWTAGPNAFWDWTEAETQSLRGYDGSVRPGASSRGIRPHSALFLQKQDPLPESKMWSDLQMAQRIKDQGSCGSCWAIATASVLEAHVEIFTGNKRTFSAQQIVECTLNPRHCGGEGGCQGATAELGMDWVMKHGCAEESVVPYQGKDAACSVTASPTLDMAQLFNDGSNPSPAVNGGGGSFGMTGWETLPKNEYEPLARALAEKGPVAVSVSAGPWFDYDTGIFNGCGKDSVIDHAVTAIGYGVDGGKKYWTIQNSWGANWGEVGHIRLERHADAPYCGMNNDPQKGVACKGEDAPVPVCGMCGVLFDSVVPHFAH